MGKKRYQLTYLQGKNTDRDTENGLVDTVWDEAESGMNWESSTET